MSIMEKSLTLMVTTTFNIHISTSPVSDPLLILSHSSCLLSCHVIEGCKCEKMNLRMSEVRVGLAK